MIDETKSIAALAELLRHAEIEVISYTDTDIRFYGNDETAMSALVDIVLERGYPITDFYHHYHFVDGHCPQAEWLMTFGDLQPES